MLKYLLSFFLIFSFLISNAQVEHSSKALTVTIGLENNRQLFSNSVVNEEFGLNPFTPFNPKYSDGYARELVVAIGSTKMLEEDNSQSWGVFGAGSSWDRNDIFDLDDTLGIIIDGVSVFAGKVKSYSVGLRYTYGLSLSHQANLNFLIGIRGELHEKYYSASASEGFGFDRSINQISLRTFLVPEVRYIVPNTQYMFSLRMGLPIASLSFETETAKNPSLTSEEQKSSGMSFDNFGFKESLFELSFGYFLLNKQ
jgi:hypothetical protein